MTLGGKLMSNARYRSVAITAAAALALFATNAIADGDWPEYNGNKAGARYLGGGNVTKDTVKNMKVVWQWAMPDNQISVDNPELRTWVNETTPIAIDGVLYTSSPMSFVSAIDGAKGKTLWTYDPKAYQDGTPPNLGFISRGVTYWEDGDDKRILAGTGDGYLLALDAKTGKPITSWGDNGRIDLTKGLRRKVDRSLVAVTSPPIVCNGVVVPSIAVLDSFAVGRPPMKYHPPGDIQAFDVKSGKRVWLFQHPPQPGEEGNETWEDKSWESAGAANLWARPSCDEELGLVYLPMSTPANDFYGGHRKGETFMPSRSWLLMRRAAKRPGTSRSSITGSGTTTCRRRPISSTSQSMAKR
jgi:quinoprotein glucose dehydrogenase